MHQLNGIQRLFSLSAWPVCLQRHCESSSLPVVVFLFFVDNFVGFLSFCFVVVVVCLLDCFCWVLFV